MLKWRQLPTTDKSQYEVRAAAIAETKALEKATREALNPQPASQPVTKAPAAGTIPVFECGWDGCDYQYDDLEDLINHVVEVSDHLKAVGTYVYVKE